MSDVGDPDPLRRGARLLWPNLPVLLTGSLLVAACWSVARAVSEQLAWLSVPGVGLVVVPVFAALLHTCGVLLRGDHCGTNDLLRNFPRSYGRALRVTLLPTAAVLLTTGALRVWELSRQPWMLGSVALGAVVTAVVGYVAVIAVPYGVRTGARSTEVWPVALYIATRNPVPVLAAASAAALSASAAAYLSFALVLLLPAPLAMIWAAGASVATDHSRARLPADVGHRPAARVRHHR